MKMREKLSRFMQGRYGVDELSRAIVIVGVIAILLATFLRVSILSLVGWAAIIIVYMRMFSRNHSKCYAQNQKYLQFVSRIKGFFRREKSHMEQRKTHHIYTCPSCKQKIRVPKGRGKIEVKCPKCQAKFVKRS